MGVRAHQLSEPYPTIDVSSPAVDAARMIGVERLPAVLVLDGGRPLSVLPGSQVLRFLIPAYLQEDLSLVAAMDEAAADACATWLSGKAVGDLLPRDKHGKYLPLPIVEGDATVMECAAVMARLHSPLLVVTDDQGQLTGTITASRLLERLVV